MGRIYRISIAIQFDAMFDELVGSMFDEPENAERDTGFKEFMHQMNFTVGYFSHLHCRLLMEMTFNTDTAKK